MKTKSRSIEKETLEATALIVLLVIFLLSGIGVGSNFAQAKFDNPKVLIEDGHAGLESK